MSPTGPGVVDPLPSGCTPILKGPRLVEGTRVPKGTAKLFCADSIVRLNRGGSEYNRVLLCMPSFLAIVIDNKGTLRVKRIIQYQHIDRVHHFRRKQAPFDEFMLTLNNGDSCFRYRPLEYFDCKPTPQYAPWYHLSVVATMRCRYFGGAGLPVQSHSSPVTVKAASNFATVKKSLKEQQEEARCEAAPTPRRDEVLLERGPAGGLGLKLDPDTLVFSGVDRPLPAANTFQGQRLTHVNGLPVDTVPDARTRVHASPTQHVLLRFSPHTDTPARSEGLPAKVQHGAGSVPSSAQPAPSAQAVPSAPAIEGKTVEMLPALHAEAEVHEGAVELPLKQAAYEAPLQEVGGVGQPQHHQQQPAKVMTQAAVQFPPPPPSHPPSDEVCSMPSEVPRGAERGFGPQVQPRPPPPPQQQQQAQGYAQQAAPSPRAEKERVQQRQPPVAPQNGQQPRQYQQQLPHQGPQHQQQLQQRQQQPAQQPQLQREQQATGELAPAREGAQTTRAAEVDRLLREIGEEDLDDADEAFDIVVDAVNKLVDRQGRTEGMLVSLLTKMEESLDTTDESTRDPSYLSTDASSTDLMLMPHNPDTRLRRPSFRTHTPLPAGAPAPFQQYTPAYGGTTRSESPQHPAFAVTQRTPLPLPGLVVHTSSPVWDVPPQHFNDSPMYPQYAEAYTYPTKISDSPGSPRGSLSPIGMSDGGMMCTTCRGTVFGAFCHQCGTPTHTAVA